MNKNKRGQESSVGMSFGLIFSIIITIAIIGVAIYAIVYFIGLNKCTQTGLFFKELQDNIDSAWQAPTKYQSVYEGKLPSSGILNAKATKVCFGSVNANPSRVSSSDRIIKDELKDEGVSYSNNVFLYPTKNLCSNMFSTTLLHVHPDLSSDSSDPSFFCVDVIDNKVSIKIVKNENDPRVSIKK